MSNEIVSWPFVVAEKFRVAVLSPDNLGRPTWYVVDVIATVTPAAQLDGEEAACNQGVVLRPAGPGETTADSDASERLANGAPRCDG